MLLNTLHEDDNQIVQEEDAPPGGKKGRYLPVFRLWRDRRSGRMVIEVDGKSIVSAERLTVEQREHLVQAAGDFSNWLGIVQAAEGTHQRLPDVSPQEHAHNSEPAPARPAEIRTSPDELAARAAATAAPLPGHQVVAPAIMPAVRARPVPLPAAVDADAMAVESKSIVMLIEEILQEKLAGSQLAHRGIHLGEDPIRGVIVKVGPDSYEGIDGVPEPEIKAALRAAVSEWERRQG